MSNYISFRPQDALLPGYLRFAITNQAFADLSPVAATSIAMLTRFSQSRVLMMVKGKSGDIVEVFTDLGYFTCREADDRTALLAMGFKKNTLMKQNYAMKYGICFQVTQGIIIQIKHQQYNYFFDIVNGVRFNDNACADRNVLPALNLIKSTIALFNAPSEKEEETKEEQYRPERKLADLLQLAENYSILSNELEEQKAQMEGNVAYHSIRSVEQDRVDRVAYQFGVSAIDEDLFKVGAQVEVEDVDQVRCAAEIIELVKPDPDSPATALVLLFNEQISITRFHRSGWFNLSFSTVNKDVQLAANEKIKTGEATAKYMDAVFGKNTPAGFEQKDLRALIARQQEKKYPPNKSQMNAICAGINTKDVFLVMGPPGTGKTTVILEWVKYFVTQEHKRVLVSSQNNKAVDNVLARIAEEKDIDIIRVGSESKLQSEVVPFMFEKKVTSLRESIVDKSADRAAAIRQAMEQWSAYSLRMNRVTAMEQERQGQYEQLRLKVTHRLLPKLRDVQKIMEEFSRAQQEKQSVVQQINVLAVKLRRHEDATNLIVKFFTGIGYNGKLKKMQELIPRLDRLKHDEQEIAARYTAARTAYLKELDFIKNSVYPPYHRDVQRCRSAFIDLSVKPQPQEGDIWDLFRDSRTYPLVSHDDIPEQKRRIAGDTQRCRQLLEVLAGWSADMASKQNYALNDIVLESVDLVGATCIGINSQKRFANLNFDVTIIDEAGQIQVHNALVPMSVSNKLIMLGDHKQIPPSADKTLLKLCEENGVKTDLLEMSLFEMMYHNLPASNKIMLDTQYRMPGEIADTISEWFYGGEYYSPPFKRGQKSLIPWLSDRPFVIIDTSGEKYRFEKKIENSGSNNEMEARIVADIVRRVSTDLNSDLKEIGVISAYKSQVRLIKQKLSGFLPKTLVGEMVATLDSYQGQERDIILYSFTKSSMSNPHERRIGFLSELRRLNVAMTRCKKMLILIGDMSFLGGCLYCKKDEFGEVVNEKNELEFSAFINKMLADVRDGRGEVVKYRTFLDRMKGGDG